jgi:hypothetical protein
MYTTTQETKRKENKTNKQKRCYKILQTFAVESELGEPMLIRYDEEKFSCASFLKSSSKY